MREIERHCPYCGKELGTVEVFDQEKLICIEGVLYATLLAYCDRCSYYTYVKKEGILNEKDK